MATYTVKKGDTLGGIARALGVDDWTTLLVNGTLAGETDPRKLAIGATVTTPDEIAPEDTPATDPADSGAVQPTNAAPDDVVITGQDIDEETGEIRQTGILGGGQTIRVSREGVEDVWMQVYNVPNTDTLVYYTFDQSDTDGDGFPDELTGMVGMNPPYVGRSQAWMEDNERRGTLQLAGGAPDIEGVSGDFTGLWNSMMDDALKAAGVTDPSLRGQILNDPRGEMATILTLASLPGSTITADEISATMRNSEVWQDIYPGIDYFYEIGVENPEVAWRQYQNQVSDTLRSLGIPPDEDGSMRSTIGEMLSEGISADEFITFAPVIENIQANPDLKAQMDAWALQELGRPLDFDEFIDVLEGTTDPELNQVVESATLAFAAEQAGVAASVEDIRRIAAETDLSPEQALRAFTEQERALLAIGNQDLQAFGVTTGDFLDVAAGIAPRSGQSAASVANIAQKLAQERAIGDDPSARFFAGFGDRGQIQRQGIRATGGEGG